ncbi:MAG TPA: metalloregulator ArsR/SmtB family transcription factor [Syntrophobacteraceae bacterium]|jgi:ArsR family transcriptional regulator|nr:metalloregulator ArsR/SmtB family transcription factor [Syntrophobacteraceae bacterium]
MRQFIKVTKALSNPNRVKIVKMLQHRSMCVCELQAALKLAQPTVSNHLKVLEEAGLVTYSKSGLRVNYSVSDGNSNPYAAALLGNLKHWMESDPQILALTKMLPELDREQICQK